jgi:hypothetical protein
MGFLSGSVVGVVFGGFIGFRVNRKIVRNSTEILSQLRELQSNT